MGQDLNLYNGLLAGKFVSLDLTPAEFSSHDLQICSMFCDEQHHVMLSLRTLNDIVHY